MECKPEERAYPTKKKCGEVDVHDERFNLFNIHDGITKPDSCLKDVFSFGN